MSDETVKYRIEIRVPAGKLSEGIQALDDGLNASMASFGFKEKVMTTMILPLTLTVPVGVSGDDLLTLKNIVLDGMRKHFGYAEIEKFEEV